MRGTKSDSQLDQEGLERWFGDGLDPLLRVLGLLVLQAVIMRDTEFAESVDDAVKDADKLFCRGSTPNGTINEAFFTWWSRLSESEQAAMTIGEAKEAIAQQLKRAKGLSQKEWSDLQRAYPEAGRLPRGRAGRKPKRTSH